MLLKSSQSLCIEKKPKVPSGQMKLRRIYFIRCEKYQPIK